MQKIAILAALLMPVLVLAQIQPTRASYNLKGAVKHITAVQKYDGIKDMNFQEEYIFEQDGRQSQYVRKGFGGRVVTEYPQPVSGDSIRVPSYDHDGDLVKVLVYTKDSVLRQSIHNIYSKPGKLEVTITYNYAPQGMIVTKRLSYYNAKRQCRMVQVLTPEDLQLRQSRKPDQEEADLVRRGRYGEQKCGEEKIQIRRPRQLGGTEILYERPPVLHHYP